MIKRVKLGDIAVSQTGPFGSQLHEDDYVEKGTPIVTVEHLGDIGFTTQNLPFVSEEDTKRLSKFLLKEGDIVFSRVGSIDRCVYVKKEQENWLFSGRCLRVRCDSSKINPRFLSYYFKLSEFKKMMLNISVGATMPSLNTSLMDDIQLLLINRLVQDKVAYFLDIIDSKIEINNAINSELEALAKTIYDYWFLQFEFPNEEGLPYKSSGGKMVWSEELKREIPEGWICETINEVSKRVQVGFVGPVDEYYCEPTEGYPIIRPSEMTKNGIAYHSLRHITKEFYERNKKSQLKYGDILISRCGKDGIPNIYDSEKMAQVLNAVIITPDTQKADSLFINETLKSDFLQKQIVNNTSGSVQGVINTKTIAQLKFAYDGKIAMLYTENMKGLYNLISVHQKENRELAALRDWLLPMLMNGQVGFKEEVTST